MKIGIIPTLRNGEFVPYSYKHISKSVKVNVYVYAHFHSYVVIIIRHAI